MKKVLAALARGPEFKSLAPTYVKSQNLGMNTHVFNYRTGRQTGRSLTFRLAETTHILLACCNPSTGEAEIGGALGQSA